MNKFKLAIFLTVTTIVSTIYSVVHAANPYQVLRDEYRAALESAGGEPIFTFHKMAALDHEQIGPQLSFLNRPQLGYFSPGIGYYDGGHGMHVPQEYMASGLATDSVRGMPLYLMYRLSKVTDEALKRTGPITQNNLLILNRPEVQIAKDNFIVDMSLRSVRPGNVILVPPSTTQSYQLTYLNSVIKGKALNQNGRCQLHANGLFVVRGTDIENEALHVAYLPLWRSPSQPPTLSPVLCSPGAIYTVAFDKVRDFNREFIQVAYENNYRNSLQVAREVEIKSTTYRIDDEITICAGSRSGAYYRIADKVRRLLPTKRISLIETAGSTDNLIRMHEGLCSHAVVQKDAIENWKIKVPSSDINELALAFKENAYFFCHRDLDINNISELTGDNTIAVGAPGSGTLLTFNEFSLLNKNLRKVRTVQAGGLEGLAATVNREADCFFTVQRPNSSYLNYIQINPELRLMPFSLRMPTLAQDKERVNSLYSPIVLEASQLPFLQTDSQKSISIDAMFVESASWSKENATVSRELRQAVNMVASTDSNSLTAPSSIRVCTGAPTGFYFNLVNLLRDQNPNISIDNIATTGSVENLAKISNGECDVSLVQGDVLQSISQELAERPQLRVEASPLFYEQALLICNKAQPRPLDFSHEQIISLGQLNSGSEFTFKRIESHFSWLKNTQRVHYDSMTSLRKVITKEISCYFHVSHFGGSELSTDLIQFAGVRNDLAAINIRPRKDLLQAAQLREIVLSQNNYRNLVGSRKIVSFEVPAYFVFSKQIDNSNEKDELLQALRLSLEQLLKTGELQ